MITSASQGQRQRVAPRRVVRRRHDTQTMYLDGKSQASARLGRPGSRSSDSLLTFNQVGPRLDDVAPGSWPGWGNHRPAVPSPARSTRSPSTPTRSAPDTAKAHFAVREAGRRAARPGSPCPAAGSPPRSSTTRPADRVKEYTDDNGGTWKVGSAHRLRQRHRPAAQRRGPRPGQPPLPLRVRRPRRSTAALRHPARAGPREEDRPGQTSPPPSHRAPPTKVCTQPDPNDPAFCTVIPGDCRWADLRAAPVGRHGHPARSPTTRTASRARSPTRTVTRWR